MQLNRVYKILVDKPWIFSKIVYWSIKSPKTPEIDFKKKKKKYQLLQKIQRSRDKIPDLATLNPLPVAAPGFRI
jgi:hypothetical protein